MHDSIKPPMLILFNFLGGLELFWQFLLLLYNPNYNWIWRFCGPTTGENIEQQSWLCYLQVIVFCTFQDDSCNNLMYLSKRNYLIIIKLFEKRLSNSIVFTSSTNSKIYDVYFLTTIYLTYFWSVTWQIGIDTLHHPPSPTTTSYIQPSLATLCACHLSWL